MSMSSTATRFIPARAGEAPLLPSTRSRPAVHPRSCGGGSRWWARKTGTPGSSPLVRGRHALSASLVQFGGFIPARAGEAPAAWLLQQYY